MNFIILSATSSRQSHNSYNHGLMKLPEQYKQLSKLDMRIYLGVGYQSKKIIEYVRKSDTNVCVIENQLYKTTLPIETARLCLNACDNESTFIFYGDQHLNIDLVKQMSTSKNVATGSIPIKKKGHKEWGIAYNRDGVMTNISYGISRMWYQLIYIPAPYMKEVKDIMNTRIFRDMSRLLVLLNNNMEISVYENTDSKYVK